MSGGPSEPSNEPSLHGAWLKKERTRLALSQRVLAIHLSVSPLRVSEVETRQKPVPSEWLVPLSGMGFRVPGSILVGPGEPPPPLGAPQDTPSNRPSVSPNERPAAEAAGAQEGMRDAKQSLTGAWLRSFCREHGLSLSQISECLDVPLDTIRYYEQHDRALPAWWVKKIEPLARQQHDGKDLVEVIMDYRLRLGRLAGQSAVEVLAWIAHDLRASGAEGSVTFDQLEAAIESLLAQRRGRRD